MEDFELIFGSAIRLAVPLMFAALGEWIAERAGTLNISLEAMMLGAAFSSVMGAAATGSAEFGLLCGIVTGLLVAFVHATFSHRLSVNTYVVGLTLNVLVLGLTSYLTVKTDFYQIDRVAIPVLSDLPLVGDALFNARWTTYLLVALIPLAWWLVQRSRWGLEARAAGENPQSADVTGIHVNKRRRQALLICGLLAGLGGAHLALAEVGAFNTNMTAGQGYIVIAAVIFGGWTLRGTLLGCLLFGGADAMRLALPAMGYELNAQLLIASPYLLALAAMFFFAKSHRGPAALGAPFVRGIT
ncbi:ABC transporter permease [Spongiactinospora sp. TRM90649]|uniref:ABC transporter permease n=1 Tax=Spongiactinospora sp. TRM90649 TaxID=3031114 RepID=UPI0023F705FF|nr:ABC transporter permease [Spongiactinospora sp. TRM90649]MDF5757547.1 ABC transporter permease [Spongiactinospora sp. TRM90649]